MDPSRYEPFEVTVYRILAETDLAIGFKEDPDERDLIWIPKSQLLNGTKARRRGESGTIVIPTWLAEEKGLL